MVRSKTETQDIYVTGRHRTWALDKNFVPHLVILVHPGRACRVPGAATEVADQHECNEQPARRKQLCDPLELPGVLWVGGHTGLHFLEQFEDLGNSKDPKDSHHLGGGLMVNRVVIVVARLGQLVHQ